MNDSKDIVAVAWAASSIDDDENGIITSDALSCGVLAYGMGIG